MTTSSVSWIMIGAAGVFALVYAGNHLLMKGAQLNAQDEKPETGKALGTKVAVVRQERDRSPSFLLYAMMHVVNLLTSLMTKLK